jgi:PAS domain S-box-containing protein
MQDRLNLEKPFFRMASLWKKFLPSKSISFPNPQTFDSEVKKIASILSVFPEAIFDAFFLETLDGKILDCNEKACEIYGYSREEMLSLSVVDLVPEEIAKILPAVMQKQIESGSFRGEALALHKNGQVFPTEISTKLFTTGRERLVAVHVRDITLSRTVETALQNSEEKYRLISENTSDLISVLDFALNPVFTYASPSHKALGYEQGELVGRSSLELMHPEDRDKVSSLLMHYLKEINTGVIRPTYSVAEHIEFRFQDKSGNWHDLDSTVNVAQNKLIVISKDITRSKETEAKLKESERRFQETLENVNLIAVQLDHTGAISSCNNYLAQISGWTKEEILGRNWFDIFIPADQRKEVVNVLARCISGEESIPTFYENIIQLRNKEIRFIKWANIQFFDLSGSVIGTSSIGIDITDSRLSEEKIKRELDKFKMFYELAMNMSSEEDMDANLEYIVSKTQELLHSDTCQVGLCEQENGSIHMYISAGARTVAFKKMKLPPGKGLAGMVLKERQGFIVEDYFNDKRFVHGVDKIIAEEGLISIIAVPIRSKEEDLGVLYVANRIKTKFSQDDLNTMQLLANLASVEIMRRKAEQTLKLSYKQLKETQQALVHSEKMAAMGQLAAGISHELFQPLTGVKGFAQAALMDIDPKSPLGELITKIIEQSARMESIIGNVRSFAKKTDFSLKPIDINQPIEDSLVLLGAQLKTHGIQVKKLLARGLPKVSADANQLQQVFINLITNAKEALERTNAQSVRELAITTGYDPEFNHVEIILFDTGAGIPKQKLAKIFEPFYTTKPSGKSMGLGLSIVQRIIDSHSGKISVESDPEKGTSFTITLPALLFPAKEKTPF